MSKIFPRPELYWEGSVENQALRAPGQEAFLWFSSLCALKATSVPFLPLFRLKNIYEHLFHSKELKRTCTISEKMLITNITIIIFFAITADSFPVIGEEKDCALYKDVGTICTVLPATPRRETYTEKTEWTDLVQVPPTERLRICNIAILWWFRTLIRTISPHTLVLWFTLYYQGSTCCPSFITDIWYYFKVSFKT